MPDFWGSSLHCVVEAACVVMLCDQFRAAVKATAAFSSRDYCLVTQSLTNMVTKIWSNCLCLSQNKAPRTVDQAGAIRL